MGPDGVGRIVSSGGVEGVNTQISVWKIQTSPTVALVEEGAAILPLLGYAGVQDAGTFTTVSSNGTQAGTAIIWATGRPTNPHTFAIHLYAYAAAPSSGALTLLYSSRAGAWPNAGYNANIVPVVANGHVFVASNQQLTIFGLGGGPFVPPAAAAAKPAALKAHAPPNQITGVLEHVDGPVLTLRTRAGTIVRVDDSDALRSGQIGVLVPGNAYGVQGTYMIRLARCVRRPSAGQSLRPRAGRRIADDRGASRPTAGQQNLARGVALLAPGILNEGRYKAMYFSLRIRGMKRNETLSRSWARRYLVQ